MSKMKFMYVVAGALGVPVAITVLALLGLNNGSALQQIAVSAVGVAIFIAIVSMRPKALSIMRGAPWMLGCFDLAIVGLALCGIYRMGAACWLLIGTIPLWAALLLGRFKLRPISLVISSLWLVALIVCNCLLLSDATRRRNLFASFRGEQIEEQTKRAEEQARWKQTMNEAAWFGSTEGKVIQAKRTTHSVVQLVDASQRHGKWFPLTLCTLFLTLSAIMVVPLFRNHYDCSMRLFGVLAALWLAAPVLVTVSAAYMVVPTANIPIPFVTCGFETVFAWVVIAVGVAWQHAGRERTPVDGF